MFDEACEVLIKLLSDTTSDFEGRYYQLTDARCEPKPVQRPHPPICIGGGGERRTLRAVAKYAQHWNVPERRRRESFQRKRAVLGEHCAAIGRDLSTITTSTHLRYDPKEDIKAFVDDVQQWSEGGLDLGIVYLPPPHGPEAVEPLAMRSRRWSDGLAGLASALDSAHDLGPLIVERADALSSGAASMTMSSRASA